MNDLLPLGVAALGVYLAGRLAGTLKQSPVAAYILAGILLGPFPPFPFLAQNQVLSGLADLGIIFLLFYLGVEFSVGRLLQAGKPILWGGTADVLINLPIGFLLGLAAGWGVLGGLFVAGIVYVSSSGIIVKAILDLGRSANPETELTLGVLIFEDLFIAIYLTIMASVASLGAIELLPLLWALLKATAFFALMVALARYGTKWVAPILAQPDELLILILFGIVTLVGVGAEQLGISAAVGAFLAGMVVAETPEAPRSARLLTPLRDLCVALFFFNVGMELDTRTLGGVAPLVVGAVLLTSATKVFTGLAAGRFQRLSQRAALALGVNLIARGEFSLVLASLAAASPALPLLVGSTIQSFTALYVLVMAILGPLLMTLQPRLAAPRLRRRTSAQTQQPPAQSP
ncbi:MAG: cation:proton antiporter [Deinococcus sp.]|nr:cation:proton antiporter [Deinococcus sp.]